MHSTTHGAAKPSRLAQLHPLLVLVLRADGVVPLRGPRGRDHPGPWKVAAVDEPHRRRRRPDGVAAPRRLLHASCAVDEASAQQGQGEEEEEEQGGRAAPAGATHHFCKIERRGRWNDDCD